MKNRTTKDGYLNRHSDGMPSIICKIKILSGPETMEEEIVCCWEPRKPTNQNAAKGYTGTARSLGGKFKHLCFHAWDQNNSEFVYYKLV